MVTGIAFSSDGRRIVTLSRDRTARIWSSTLSTAVTALDTLAGDTYLNAAFSANGRMVVATSQRGIARIWQLNGSRDVIDESTTFPRPIGARVPGSVILPATPHPHRGYRFAHPHDRLGHLTSQTWSPRVSRRRAALPLEASVRRAAIRSGHRIVTRRLRSLTAARIARRACSQHCVWSLWCWSSSPYTIDYSANTPSSATTR